MRSVLGFDGGGTRCEALRIDETGRLLGWGRGGTTHEWYGQADLVEPSVEAAIRDALAPAGASASVPSPELCMMCGPTGRKGAARLIELMTPAPVRAVSESDAFFAAALEDSGLLVLAGTGSFAHGRRADGRALTAGGAGPVIGDDGSAHDIGILALRAAVLAGQLTAFRGPCTDAVRRHFDCDRRWHLVELYHRHHPGRLAIADVARIVTQHAEEGDPAARRILDTAASRIAEIAREVVAEIDLRDEKTVILAGGATASPAYREALARHLVPLFAGEVNVIQPKYRPSVGAALLALRELGVEWSPGLVERLDQELAANGLADPIKG